MSPSKNSPTERAGRAASRPVLAASVAIVREGRVLLAQRAGPPLAGVYSLPGGKVEAGETLAEAALREVAEETGLVPELGPFLDHREVIGRDEAGAVTHHFVIAAFAARWRGGEPRPCDEVLGFRWVTPEDAEKLPTSPGLGPILRQALAAAI